MQITKIEIDGSRIVDFVSFHAVFKQAMGFLEGYGNNMNAWIDCMRDIHEDTGMSRVLLPDQESLVLQITSTSTIDESCPEVLETLSACTAFVNEHLKQNNQALIYLLFV
jgi:RNAse (barnase) inhibitor barstar